VQLYARVPRLNDMIGIIFRYHVVFYLLFGLLMFITFEVWIIVFKALLKRRLSAKAGWASGASRRLGFGSKVRRSACRRSSPVSARALGERGAPWKGGEGRSGWRTGRRTADWGCCGDGGLGAGRQRDRLGSGRIRDPVGVRESLGEAILAADRRRDRERERERERDVGGG
jgi:hypothetical protein